MARTLPPDRNALKKAMGDADVKTLAMESGISRNTLEAWLNGTERRSNFETVNKLAVYLGIDVVQLQSPLDDKGNLAPPPDHTLEVKKLIDNSTSIEEVIVFQAVESSYQAIFSRYKKRSLNDNELKNSRNNYLDIIKLAMPILNYYRTYDPHKHKQSVKKIVIDLKQGAYFLYESSIYIIIITIKFERYLLEAGNYKAYSETNRVFHAIDDLILAMPDIRD